MGEDQTREATISVVGPTDFDDLLVVARGYCNRRAQRVYERVGATREQWVDYWLGIAPPRGGPSLPG
jgi:hypothetical protein